MQKLKRIFVVMGVLLLTVGSALMGAQAQVATASKPAAPSLQNPIAFKNPLAYVGEDGNVYITDDNSGRGQPVTGDSAGGPTAAYPFFNKTMAYGQFSWSPLGNMLAFSERINKTITVVESGKVPNVVAKGVDSGFPPSFSPDGKDIAYVVQTNQQTGANNADLILQIQAVPAAGGAPRALGSLVGTPWMCGGETFDIADLVYLGEIGNLSDSPMYFAWTKQGYLHTLGCTGRGLGLSNGVKNIWENKNLMNPALSADQTKLLAISADDQGKNKQLNMVDLTTGALTPVKTQANVDRAIFSFDGKRIIYSTVEPGTTAIKGDANNAVGKQLFDTFWPAGGTDNAIMLWSMPVEGGDSIVIYKTPGRGIGYISPAHHQPQVAFSAITSLVKMITSINNGNPANTALELVPHSDVVTAFTDNTSPPAIVARGGQPSFGPGSDFSVIPAQPSAAAPTLVGSVPTLVQVVTVVVPTTAPIVITATSFLPTPTIGVVAAVGGVCPGFLPSRLHAPGQGRVLPGRANRLRTSPETGAILTTIPAGGVFDVLDNNKICTSDGIAWWHVRYLGVEGYTAEGVGTSYWLEPYTGGPTLPPPPPPGSFGIVGVTAAVNPGSSGTCPTTFNFTGQIVVNSPGTVTYRWERSDGSAAPTETWNATAGALTKDESISWNIGATYSGWERIHVLTPNDVYSNQATFTLNCGGGFAVTGVSASVDSNSKVACNPGGATFNFNGTITTNGAGTVTYKWERSDGASAPTQSISFGGAGSQNVSTSWFLGQDNSHHYNGWQRLHVLTPNDAVSNQANFTAHCP